jgi:hypothetical protein
MILSFCLSYTNALINVVQVAELESLVESLEEEKRQLHEQVADLMNKRSTQVHQESSLNDAATGDSKNLDDQLTLIGLQESLRTAEKTATCHEGEYCWIEPQ